MNKPMKSIFKLFLRVIAVVAIVVGILLSTTTGSYTPAITDSNGDPLPTAIAEERMLILGGVEQYVLLRGADKSKPLLIYVHGGPGMTSTPFLRTYNEALERSFLVAYWEQRGTNNSYSDKLDDVTMDIDQITSDLSELVTILLSEFNQEKVLLVGHSWGTIPSLEYASASPDTVAAYVAVSQTVNQIKSDNIGYEWALAEARRQNYKKSIETLEELGPPPYTYDEFVTQRKQVNFLGGSMVKPHSDLKLAWVALQTPEFSWPKLGALVDGVRFSGESLWEEQQQYDALERHSKLDVPFFILSGRHDRVISPELGEAFLDSVDAPLKKFIWFEKSSHAPQFEEPTLFNATIIQIAQQVGLGES